MLGINCVPGTALRLLLFIASDAGCAGLGNRPTAAAAACSGPAVIAFSNAPRCERTLLTASGDTCGAESGLPTPGVVVPSSAGIDAGGGP